MQGVHLSKPVDFPPKGIADFDTQKTYPDINRLVPVARP